MHPEIKRVLGSTVARTFVMIGVAEELLAAWPSAPRGLFPLLCPPVSLRDMDLAVYRSHAEELIARARRKEDLRPATDAEVLSALSATSLTAPLNANGSALMDRLFRRIFGRAVAGEPAREMHPGAADDLLHEVRRHNADPERRLEEAAWGEKLESKVWRAP